MITSIDVQFRRGAAGVKTAPSAVRFSNLSGWRCEFKANACDDEAKTH